MLKRLKCPEGELGARHVGAGDLIAKESETFRVSKGRPPSDFELEVDE